MHHHLPKIIAVVAMCSSSVFRLLKFLKLRFMRDSPSRGLFKTGGYQSFSEKLQAKSYWTTKQF